MPPKPFPLPYRIGTDIASISRQYALLRKLLSVDLGASKPRTSHLQNGYGQNFQGRRFQRYLGRIFNRREWPEVEARTVKILNLMSKRALPGADEKLKAETHEATLKLASWLAGRWAAKEAAIKAHPARTLYMRQITILKPDGPNLSDVHFDAQAVKGRPVMLVDPLVPRISMSVKTASRRGIAVGNPKNLSRQTEIVRDGRVEIDQCQVADVSISHDGDFAIATVLAAHDDSQYGRELPCIVDDGTSRIPLHEPIYLDRGFYGPEYLDGTVQEPARTTMEDINADVKSSKEPDTA